MSETRSENSLEPRDLEAIAAFLDGRLSGSDRERFLERLDREAALYEIFVEAVRHRDESAAKKAEVVRHPAARKAPTGLWWIAAVLVVALAVPVLLWPRGPLSGPRLARSLTAEGRLDGRLQEDWFEQGWAVMRGISPGVGEADTAFRIGVRTVDLDVALRQALRPGEGDEPKRLLGDAERLTYRIEALLRDVEFSAPIAPYYSSVREQIAADAPEEALELTAAVDPHLGDLFAELDWAYRFGQWAEAGKLAAQSGDAALLGSRAFRRAGRDFARQRLEEVPAAELARINAALAAGGLDLAALETAFAGIIDES